MSKPKIRFKGYEEDWEQRKLGEVATVLSTEAAYSSRRIAESSGKYSRFYRVGSVL